MVCAMISSSFSKAMWPKELETELKPMSMCPNLFSASSDAAYVGTLYFYLQV